MIPNSLFHEKSKIVVSHWKMYSSCVIMRSAAHQEIYLLYQGREFNSHYFKIFWGYFFSGITDSSKTCIRSSRTGPSLYLPLTRMPSSGGNEWNWEWAYVRPAGQVATGRSDTRSFSFHFVHNHTGLSQFLIQIRPHPAENRPTPPGNPAHIRGFSPARQNSRHSS